LIQVSASGVRGAQNPLRRKQNHALEIPMKAPNSHTLLLAAAIALGAILAVAGAAFAFGHQGTAAQAPAQSPYSVPF
jgi:hypothetical protein